MDNPALDLEFDGPDANLTSSALIVFRSEVERDATDAAFNLKRTIDAIVEAKRSGKPMQCHRPRCPVVSIHSGVSGLGKRPSYNDFFEVEK